MGAVLGKPYSSASSSSNGSSDALIHSISDAARADQDNTMINTAASASSQSSSQQQQARLHQQEQPPLRPSSQTKHSCVRTTLTTSNSSLHPSPRVPGAPLPPALAPIPHSSDGSGGDGRGENFITNSLLHNCATRVFSASETTPSSVEGKGSSKDPTRKNREKELVRENSAMSKLNDAAAHPSMQTSQEQQEQQTHTKAATSCIENSLVSSSGISQLTSSGHEKEGGGIRDTSCSAVAAAVVGSKTSAATAYLSEIEKKQKHLQHWDAISTTNAINTYVDSTSSPKVSSGSNSSSNAPFPSISNMARLNQETTTNIAANSASSYSSSQQQQQQPLHLSKCENDNNEGEKTPMMDNKEKNSDSHRDTVSITTFILTGMLAYSDRENLRRHIIRGNWKYEHSIDATPQRFELIRIIPPEEDLKELPKDGEFNGSFNVQNQVMTSKMKTEVKNRAVLENGVMLTFTSKKVKKDHFDDDNSNHTEKYTVFGRGTNEFGVFELHGTATKNKVLEEGDDPTYSISVRKVYDIGPNPPMGAVEDKSKSGSKERNHSDDVGKDDSTPKPPPPTVLANEGVIYLQGNLVRNAAAAGGEKFKAKKIMRKCRDILQELIDSDARKIFISPVDPVALNIPTYFDVIKKPMDLGTIKMKMKKKEIDSPIEFARLVRLTFENAILFNKLPTHEVNIQARCLLAAFNKKFGLMDEEYIPPKKNKLQEEKEAVKDARRPLKKEKKHDPEKGEASILSTNKSFMAFIAQAVSDDHGTNYNLHAQAIKEVQDQTVSLHKLVKKTYKTVSPPSDVSDTQFAALGYNPVEPSYQSMKPQKKKPKNISSRSPSPQSNSFPTQATVVEDPEPLSFEEEASSPHVKGPTNSRPPGGKNSFALGDDYDSDDDQEDDADFATYYWGASFPTKKICCGGGANDAAVLGGLQRHDRTEKEKIEKRPRHDRTQKEKSGKGLQESVGTSRQDCTQEEDSDSDDEGGCSQVQTTELPQSLDDDVAQFRKQSPKLLPPALAPKKILPNSGSGGGGGGGGGGEGGRDVNFITDSLLPTVATRIPPPSKTTTSSLKGNGSNYDPARRKDHEKESARENSATTKLNTAAAKASFIISPQIASRTKKRPLCSSKDEQPAKRFSIKIYTENSPTKSISRVGIAHSTTTSMTKPGDVASWMLASLPAEKAATLPLTKTDSSDIDDYDSSDIEDVTEIFLAKPHKELPQVIKIDDSDDSDAEIKQDATGKKNLIEILIDEEDMPVCPGVRVVHDHDTYIPYDSENNRSIKQRIVKLLNTGFCVESNEHEARTALKHARRLMERYNLDQALLVQELGDGPLNDLRATNNDNGSTLQGGLVTVNIITKKSREPLSYRPRWLRFLSRTVSLNFHVDSFWSFQRRTPPECSVTFYGILGNVQLAAYAYKIAGERISQMASAYHVEPPTKKLLPTRNLAAITRTARLSYALGIVNGLKMDVKEGLRREEERRKEKLKRAQQNSGKGEAYDDDSVIDCERGVDTVEHAQEKVQVKVTPEHLERENNAHLALIDYRKKIADDVLKLNNVKLVSDGSWKSITLNQAAYDKGTIDSKKIDLHQKAIKE